MLTASEARPGDRKAIEEKAARLFVRLSLNPDLSERAAIHRWIGEADAHAIAFAKVDDAWRNADRLKALGPEHAGNGDPAQILDPPDPMIGRYKLASRRSIGGIAAAVAGIILALPFLQGVGQCGNVGRASLTLMNYLERYP